MRTGRGTGRDQPGRRRGGAFTLMEMLIAVGVVALVAVGLAVIFDAIGQTVRGGQRASEFNAVAARLERQLRADFRRMTREGFLVIRNQLTTDTAGNVLAVRRFDGDPSPRPRRIDEILFFARGPFVTAREAVDPRLIATAESARIYYGHGVSLPEDHPAYRRPWYDDAESGQVPGLPGGPNEFAADWALVRHVTLLHPLSTATRPLPDPPPLGLSPAFVQDTETRVALQPAASEIFRSLAARLPTRLAVTPGCEPALEWTRPLFESGLVDVATTDLAEIRQMVLALRVPPPSVSSEQQLWQLLSAGGTLGGRLMPADATVLPTMRQWMLEALPANSAGQYARPRSRLRTEPGPTDFFGVLALTDAVDQLYRRADQRMLSSGRFLPRCTEFVVEWSFGLVDQRPGSPTQGQIIWHGMDRIVGRDPAGDDIYAARPYPLYPDASGARITPMPTVPFALRGGGTGQWPIRETLISDAAVPLPPSAAQYDAFFGYIDPTFDPEAQQAEQDTIAWPWPRLFRVTVTLADPAEPSIEQTFQFVIESPVASAL